jgi:hypothetical protein
MGKLLSSLSSALSGTTAGTKSAVPQPQVMPAAPQQPGMTDMSSPAAQQPGISMQDLYAPTQGQPAQAPAPADNPYTQYDNSGTPADVAQSVGTPVQQPITITGDDWHPKDESLLGKIGDMMFGGETFRHRTDQANLKSAMQSFQKDPETAINRVRQVDPKAAWDMYQNLSGIKANEALEQQRIQDRQDKGRDRLGNMLGALDGPNAAAIYEKQLPMYRKYAEKYNLDPSELPDKYDADAIAALREQGISGYDQERLKQGDANQKSLEGYRNTQIELSKIGKQIELGNLNERIRSDQVIESRLDKSQVLAAREQASKEGVSKDADGNPTGMGVTLNSFFAPYMNMKRGQYVVSPDKTQVLMKRADGYIYKYPLAHREDGSAYIDLDNPIIRGTTVDGYLSK